MPPNSRKRGLIGRLSSVFKGGSSKSAVEPSQPVDKTAYAGAGPLQPHDPSPTPVPLTPANYPTASSVEGSVSQLSKHRSANETKATESLPGAIFPAASTSASIPRDPRPPASEGNAPLSLYASSSFSGSPEPTSSGEETVTPPGLSFLSGAHNFQMGYLQLFDAPNATHVSTQSLNADHQNNTFIGNQYLFSVGEDLIRRLNPILDASHTRNRARSPPDSECFPGTRENPIGEIVVWADSGEMIRIPLRNSSDSDPDSDSDSDSDSTAGYTMKKTPHIYWLHGFAGCGKSSISLAVAKIYAGSGRLLGSYFFYRGTGDRSTMNRFGVTLASQLVAAIPATAPLIEAAVRTEPGLVTGDVSLATQLDLLILSPLQAVISKGILKETLSKGPFLIVVDGLDECKDKRGVQEFIDHLLAFFEERPLIPLRIFIASRVEQHIRECLDTDGVLLGNLDSHSPRKDIEKFLEASFQRAEKRNRVIRAYVRERGGWPVKSDMDKLIEHVGGSFVLASTIFKYIVQPATIEDPMTPMERLPLTFNMNGLDGLYAQTLARSKHLPHFHNIISTIALAETPLSIVTIAELLGIQAFEVVRVLLSLQAIIHVPGTDKEGEVTLCHTSLRDFLTTESRSGCFFVPLSFHLRLSYYFFVVMVERDDHSIPSNYYVPIGRHWYLLTPPEACDFIDEIKRFEEPPSPFVGKPASHTFLCSMYFYTILFPWDKFPISDFFSYILTEGTKQLALAVECPDSHIQLWLGKEVTYGWTEQPTHTFQFTEQTYETVQQHLRRASTAIHAKFPELLNHCQLRPTGTERELEIKTVDRSGIDIFTTLEWMVARAHFKWEEANLTPRPPLGLSIARVGSPGNRKITFSFDGIGRQQWR